ncbi:MAG: hypothetical protein C0467_29895 [Planctomycetaceae bacterium]|nr:hypothetical protein [Planctomycetaceae bacterium]
MFYSIGEQSLTLAARCPHFSTRSCVTMHTVGLCSQSNFYATKDQSHLCPQQCVGGNVHPRFHRWESSVKFKLSPICEGVLAVPVLFTSSQFPSPRQADAIAPEGLGFLAAAADSLGVPANSPTNEWPYNLLSQRAVAFGSGRIARAGDPVVHDYDPAELERCHQFAAEVASRLRELPVRSLTLGDMQPFCLPANRNDPAPTELTPDVVRAAFRDTLHPWVDIRIEPLSACSARDIFQETSVCGFKRADVQRHNKIWAELTKWYTKHPDLGSGWFVTVENALWGYRPLRLIVGLTRAGSLVGAANVGEPFGQAARVSAIEWRASMLDMDRPGIWKVWMQPGTAQLRARVILRTFGPDVLGPWAEATAADAKKLKPKERALFWRVAFRQLTPQRTLSLSPAWGTVHRCIGRGGLAQDTSGPQAFFWMPLGENDRSGEWRYTLNPDEARTVATRLAAIDATEFRRRYDNLRATDYAPHMSEADFQATLEVFQSVKELYQQAAGHSAVVVELTTRMDEELQAETAGSGKATVKAEKNPSGKRGKSPKAAGVVTDCIPNNEMLAPLLQCLDNLGDEDGTEWPRTDLSIATVRYTCGTIAREGEEVEHRHDSGELERCRTLATEAERLLKALVPPHDAGGPYLAFFRTANTGDPVPASFSEEFVRTTLFNGTINPEVGVSVEPLTAEAVWYDGSAGAATFVDWLRGQPGLHGFAFIKIGLNEDSGGASHPRLAVALTDRGSVVGVCGYVIWA